MALALDSSDGLISIPSFTSFEAPHSWSDSSSWKDSQLMPAAAKTTCSVGKRSPMRERTKLDTTIALLTGRRTVSNAREVAGSHPS